ncbi:MAG: ATP-binding protein [Oligoflexia bacterium]|nr:ATP-binding protein [Oligoflexia bacterium]
MGNEMKYQPNCPNKSVKITIPNMLEYVKISQAFAFEMAKKVGFKNEEELNQVEIAIEEAVTNVIKHAFEKNERSTFDIICTELDVGLKIIIKEKGLPFDPKLFPKYSLPDSLNTDGDMKSLSSEGLGLHLMKNLMNEVSFHNLGAEGKEIHMIKYLPGVNIDEYKARTNTDTNAFENEKAKNKDLVAVISEKINYSVRRMKEEEAIEVSKGAYKSHGYTFFDDNIYFPDKLVELNKKEQLISIVAVSDKEEFMGHVAFFYPYVGASIAELTFAFVNPEYRSQGCLKKLTECLFTTPKKYPLVGAYAYSVTNHLFTQKALIKYDFLDCGIELATSPASWHFKGIDGDTSQRITVALGFRYMNQPKSLNLYPPSHHLEMIKKLYHNIKANDHHYLTDKNKTPKFEKEDSKLEVVLHSAEGSVEIFIYEYGSNILKEIKLLLRNLCVQQMASITLFLKLEDPTTAIITSEFEKMGFFFSGILPASSIGDALILQYLNNINFDYSKVQLLTDIAKETLNYIKKCDPNG